MSSRRILIVEDEAVLRRIVADAMTIAGYEVRTAENGEEGLHIFSEFSPHLVIADIMMPRMDGLEMVDKMQAMCRSTMFIFLSARSGADDVVEGFRAGGNDYLRKPFAMNELLVRVEALLKREEHNDGNTLFNIGAYLYDTQQWTLEHNGTVQRLSAREAAVLTMLIKNSDQVVTTRAILLDIWGDDSYYNQRSLNVFVSKLRNRLADDPNVEITAIRGIGYKIRCR